MSDCPDCDNVGWTWECDETDEFGGKDYRRRCTNWRHQPRPSLAEIAATVRATAAPATFPYPHRTIAEIEEGK